ncbi:MAG: hypothetical protein U0V48_18145 [Anaerolineales bacterium]
MAGFKLTYGTMFNPPEALHEGFDKAVAKLKQNLGKEYGMFIDGKDVFSDEKFEDHSPVNTSWTLARMQKETRFTRGWRSKRRAKPSPRGVIRRGKSAWRWCAKRRR